MSRDSCNYHQLHKNILEDSIYRMPHLGLVPALDNLLVMRFSNVMFEPIWNRKFISCVMVTANVMNDDVVGM